MMGGSADSLLGGDRAATSRRQVASGEEEAWCDIWPSLVDREASQPRLARRVLSLISKEHWSRARCVRRAAHATLPHLRCERVALRLLSW